MCWSLCRPRRRENEVQESTICCDFGIVFWSLCRPRRRLKKGQVSRRSKSTFFILSAVFLSGSIFRVIFDRSRSERENHYFAAITLC